MTGAKQHLGLVIGLLILAALIGGGLFLKGTPAAPAPVSSERAIITYTDEGFSPETVTIPLGGTVEFVNQSKRPFWPASDPHPVHTLYPEQNADDCLGSAFDACGPILPGESYEFTFDRAGSWPYHDHMLAGHVGIVVVNP